MIYIYIYICYEHEVFAHKQTHQQRDSCSCGIRLHSCGIYIVLQMYPPQHTPHRVVAPHRKRHAARVTLCRAVAAPQCIVEIDQRENPRQYLTSSALYAASFHLLALHTSIVRLVERRPVARVLYEAFRHCESSSWTPVHNGRHRIATAVTRTPWRRLLWLTPIHKWSVE